MACVRAQEETTRGGAVGASLCAGNISMALLTFERCRRGLHPSTLFHLRCDPTDNGRQKRPKHVADRGMHNAEKRGVHSHNRTDVE